MPFPIFDILAKIAAKLRNKLVLNISNAKSILEDSIETN
jgi:hypothetical protein